MGNRLTALQEKFDPVLANQRKKKKLDIGGQLVDSAIRETAAPLPEQELKEESPSSLSKFKESVKTSVSISPEVSQAFGYNPQLESPNEYQKRIKELQASLKAVKTDIPEEEAKQFQERRNQISSNISKIQQALKEDLAQARSEQERREAAVRWGQVGETIGHALVKVGAAIHGLKTGVDLSTGLKFDKNDWNAEFDRILKDIEARRAEAKAEATMKTQEQERQAGDIDKEESIARRTAERAGEREFDLAAQRLVKAEGEVADIVQRNTQALNRSKEFNAEQMRRNNELNAELAAKMEIKKIELAAKQAAAEGKPDKEYEQKLKIYGDMQGALASLIQKDRPEARKQFTDAAVQLGMPIETINNTIKKATGEGWATFQDAAGAQAQAASFSPQRTRQSSLSPVQSGLVRVTNGKEILEIPEADVPAAEADGYRRM